MNDMLTEMTLQIADGLQSRSLTNCLRWAAKRRTMTGDFAGPYSAKYHPWAKGMLTSKSPYNYVMKGAQLGVTEVLLCLAFFTLDQLCRDVLYVLPTSKNASDFSKSRFGPAIKNSPYLKGLFTDINAVELKQAGSNTLYIRGSRGDSNLKSIPVSVLLMDEIDEMSQRAIALALERLSGSLSKTVWGISTPTVPGFGIDKLYRNSTQEHFTFQCPCCSRHTELIWPDCVEIIGESVSDARCVESFLKCKECGGRLEHQAKPDWLSKAVWTPTDHGANPDVRGFTISQLYSFTITPGELVVAHYKGYGDEAALIEFHNSKLGKPFVGDGAKVTDEDITACIRGHSKEDARPRVGGERLITLGIDQGKWNYLEVAEWSFDNYSSDLNVAAKCKVLFETKFHEEDWNILDELMREWQILACVIDADPQIMEARRFARRFPGYVWLCRFRRGVTAKEISEVENDNYAPIIHTDRTNWFSAALGRFREPRRITLPRDVSHEYQQHLKAPIRTYVKNPDDGNPIAKFISTEPDHFALARVYNEIALPHAASIQTGQDISKFL